MRYQRENDEEIDFGSQLSIGYKGMLINDNWITWQCDKSGYPHHDHVSELYYNGEAPEVSATYWFDESMNIFSQYGLFDERTQIPLRNVYGNVLRLNLNIESVDGESFSGTYGDYKRAERKWEDKQETVKAWIRARCKFAAAVRTPKTRSKTKKLLSPPTQFYPPTQDEEKKYEQAVIYFNIGHGEETESSFDPGTHVVWVLNRDMDIEKAPGNKTHGIVWGHDFSDQTWKGRYEGDTGRLSIVSPKSFRGAPSWLMDKLESAFGFISEIHQF